MTGHSRRMALTLGCAVLLFSCCDSDEDTFYPHHFGTGMAKCLGEDLVKQGFTGPMNLGTTIEFVGPVNSAGKTFNIYSYDFVNDETDHGSQRILVLDTKCNYIGSYSTTLTMPSSTSGADILFDVPKVYGNVIRFENGQAPKRVWFDGQIADLLK